MGSKITYHKKKSMKVDLNMDKWAQSSQKQSNIYLKISGSLVYLEQLRQAKIYEYYLQKINEEIKNYRHFNAYEKRQIHKIALSGVPLDRIRVFIKGIFNINSDSKKYDIVCKTTFKDKDMPDISQTPTFGFTDNIYDIDSQEVLTTFGIKCLQRILWNLHHTHDMKITPLVAPVCVLLQCFMEEHEVFSTINGMKLSQKFVKNFQGFFQAHFENFKQQVQDELFNFVQTKDKDIRDIFMWLQENKIVPVELIKDMFQSFFMNYLRIDFNSKRLDQREIDYLFQKAKEQELPNEKLLQMQKMRSTQQNLDVYYIPKYNQNSKILKAQDFYSFWALLDKEYKTCDFELVFNLAIDGFSLQTLYSKCEEFTNKPMVMFIQNEKKQVFGFFCEKMIDRESDAYTYKNLSSFLFKMGKDQPIKFPNQNLDSCIMVSTEELVIGLCETGAAIQFTSNLQHGQSYKTNMYENDRFSHRQDSSFDIMNMEIYVLV